MEQSLIMLNTSTGKLFIDTSSIVRIEASSNYSKLYFSNGRMIVASKVLKWFEEKLQHQSFIRLHRSHLVNNRFLQMGQCTGKEFEMQNGKIIRVSRRRRKLVLMKFLAFFMMLFFFQSDLYAQNVGIGINEPLNKLHVNGNLLVNTPTTATSTAPTVAQTITIVNGNTISFVGGDSTGRIYDPGGPAGNYNANLLGFVNIPTVAGAAGIELTVETMELGTGDSLIIKETAGSTTNLLAVGNGYTSTGKWVFNTGRLHLTFKSNADANVGSGFSLLFSRLYDNSSSQPDIGGVTGRAFFFDTKTGSLRSGLINNSIRGVYSSAMGFNTIASGFRSTALGNTTTANGDHSTAMGQNTTASGTNSTAMGQNTTASGFYSTAMGNGTTATGDNSTAMGNNTDATGSYSTTMGSNTTASEYASTAMGYQTEASGFSSTAMGRTTISRGYAGTAIGMYNVPIFLNGQLSPTPTTPLFIIGNGDDANSLDNAMIVLKSGNTGIGTSYPQTKLHIVGGTDATLSDNSGYLVIGDVGGTNLVFDNNEILARNNGVNATLFLQNNGGAFEIGGSAFKPGGGSWTATSDVRLKQNVKPYSDGLQQLLRIKPVQFQYNQLSGYDTKKQHIGVLAQELNEVAPYMVSTFTKNNTDYLNVDNTAMTYMLINAVKEQQKQIEELKVLVNQLLKNK
jgi:Chaperone of endosialidase/LytTr DNA-binding domain/Head domain of trimeric autotransporter adhesin